MANIDNLYEILGLEADASFDQIRSAYRQLARQIHPDVAGQASSERFVRINLAYETLIDSRNRRDYDLRSREVSRAVTRRTVVSTTRVGNPIFLNTLLADVFSTMATQPAEASQRVDVQPVHIELVLAPEAVQTGAQVRLDLPVVITCRNCRGSGLAEPFVCPACRGRGRWPDSRAVEFFLAPPVRDGQVLTVELPAEGVPVGPVHVHIRLSWL